MRDRRVEALAVGTYMTAARCRDTGCAWTDNGGAAVPHFNPPIRPGGPLVGRRAGELAEWIVSEVPLERSIGMAVCNSLFSERKENLCAGNPLPWLKQRFQGARIRMVGYFEFAPVMREWTDDFRIIENADLPDVTPFEQADTLLAEAELLIVTGVTLLNGSLLEVLRRAPDAYRVIFGPTAPFCHALLEAGARMIVGLSSLQAEDFFSSVAEGRIVPCFRGCELAVLSSESLQLPSGSFFR